MRLTCTCVALLLFAPAFAQEKARPKVLNWKDIPLSEDADLAEKVKRLKTEYEGKEVVVTGLLRGPISTGQQDIVFGIENPTRRGELVLYQRVRVQMYQVLPARISALVDKRVTVTGIAKSDADVHGSRLLLDKARFVTGKAVLRKKP